jgi:hypothetical protein
VFGQNLTERAENFSPEPKEVSAAATSGDESVPEIASSSSAAATPAADPKSPKSLTESAAAYYESHATPKRKYDEVRSKGRGRSYDF